MFRVGRLVGRMSWIRRLIMNRCLLDLVYISLDLISWCRYDYFEYHASYT